MPPVYVATGLLAESVSAADGEVVLAVTLTMENIGGPVVTGTLDVEVSIEGEEYSETIQLEVEAADMMSHEFDLTVPPGTVRFDVNMGHSSFSFNRVARAADLRIVDTDWRAVSDGQIAVVATVLNDGNVDAEQVIAIASVNNDGGTESEGEGGATLILAGEELEIEVLLDVPAGENEILLSVSTDSLEAVTGDNLRYVSADVAYVEIRYVYTFEPVGYRTDGSADVEMSVTARNDGVATFGDIAEVSYSRAGASPGGNEATGKLALFMRNGFSSPAKTVTIRSSPGALVCIFGSLEQGTESRRYEVEEKVMGVSREVWECYSDDTINRHGDIGCAGREDERVVKWDLSRPLRVWATGDQRYVEVLWRVLDRIEPVFGMEFEETQSETNADLKAWMGITREEGPERWKTGLCADAVGCATADWGTNRKVTEAMIAVWLVESEWLTRTSLVNRRIEHTTLQELVHALVPMDHRDDPLSVVNIRNAPDWTELDPFEEALIRLHRHPLIEPGMTMDEVRQVVVLEDEILDRANAETAELTPLEMLREAFRRLQDADSATWQMEGGWRGARCESELGRAEYTIASFYAFGPTMTRFFGGSDRLILFGDEDWARDAGEWSKNPSDLWEDTEWRHAFSNIHILLVSALYFAYDYDVRVSSVIAGETWLRFTLRRSVLDIDWSRSLELRGRVIIDNETFIISGYEMDWLFDAVRSNTCERYVVRTSGGQYGVRFDVPDRVYFGTNDDVREAIDRINGER